MRLLIAASLCLLALRSHPLAAPRSGFGLAGGPVAHRTEVLLIDLSTQRYDSAGLTLLGDAQFVVNERWSLNPFLMLSLERASGDIRGTVSYGASGFQVRRWLEGLFVAGHLGYYVELLTDPRHSRTVYGEGLGLALGGERGDGVGWIAQVDLPRVLVHDESRIGLSLLLSLRWH
jgi:hypothetical protein